MMDCIAPGTTTPEDLLAYVAGEADAPTIAHIDACPACAAQAAAYAATDRLLQARLFRVDCPDTQTLGDLAMQLIAPEDTLVLRAHLSRCPHCSAELATLEADLREPALAAPRPKAAMVARLVARLLPSPAPGMTYAGLRGASGGTPPTYQVGGITLSLTVEPEGSAPPRRWSLLALVLDDAGAELPSGAAAQLLRDDRRVAETALDELGNLVFPGLEAGSYDLELTLPGRLIVVEQVVVGSVAV